MTVSDCHLELDTSDLLGLDDHKIFHMLLGILQWMVIIGKPELCQLVACLNRFGACPREAHLELAGCSFGYVKATLHLQIAVDSRPMQFKRVTPDFDKLRPDFLIRLLRC